MNNSRSKPVFSKTRNALVVTSEIAKSQSKSGRRQDGVFHGVEEASAPVGTGMARSFYRRAPQVFCLNKLRAGCMALLAIAVLTCGINLLADLAQANERRLESWQHIEMLGNDIDTYFATERTAPHERQ